MKKILVVTEVFYPESFLINDLVQEWQKNGYQIDILTQWPSYPYGKIFKEYNNKYYEKEQWGTSIIHRFKLVEGYKDSKIKKIINYWVFIRIGTKIAKKIGKDYDHVFVHQTGPLTLAFPAIAIKKKYNIPVTIWTFDIWPNTVYAYGFPSILPIRIILHYIIKTVYRNCNNILVSSQRFIGSIKQYATEKDIHYIPNWFIKENFVKCDLRLDQEKYNFTFAGNISISQNMEKVIYGFVKADLKNAVLNIIGDGSMFFSLKRLVDNLHLKNVMLHGRYPYNQIMDVLKQSDILILSLRGTHGIDKTEPLKLQSYLYVGKPILGICGGGGEDIICQEKIGLCANPENVDDIADKFKKALNFSDDDIKMIQKRSENLLKTRFNRELIIDKISTIIGFK